MFLAMKVVGKGSELLNSYLAGQSQIVPWPTLYRSPHHQSPLQVGIDLASPITYSKKKKLKNLQMFMFIMLKHNLIISKCLSLPLQPWTLLVCVDKSGKESL